MIVKDFPMQGSNDVKKTRIYVVNRCQPPNPSFILYNKRKQPKKKTKVRKRNGIEC